MWGAKHRAILLWAVAGIPIIAGTIQSIGALDVGPLEERFISQWPVVGPVARWLNTREIFLEAGLGFFAAGPLVYLLFLMIAFAWLAYGVTFVDLAPLRSQQREYVKIGTICFSGILYVVLFYWVFREVFFLEVPLHQRIAFGLLPLFVTGSLALSWQSGPTVSDGWGSELEAQLDEKRRSFETDFETRVEPALDTLGRLPFDRSKIVAIRDRRREFEERCKSLEERITDVRADIAGGDETVPEAEQIEHDVKGIDPDAELESLEEQLREELRALYDERYAVFWETLESPDGTRYGDDIVNIPQFPSSVHLPVQPAEELSTDELYIKSIDKIRTELLRSGVAPDVAVEAIAKLERYIYDDDDGLIAHIESKETTFVELHAEIETTLEDIETVVDRIGGEVSETLSRRYIEGESSSASVREIRDNQDSAHGKLNQCRFEEAIEELEAERDRAEDLYEAADFVELAVSTANDDRPYVDLPVSFDESGVPPTRDDLAALEEPFSADTGRSFSVDRAERQLSFNPLEDTGDITSNAESKNETDGDGRGGSADQPDQEDIETDAHHHLKRLQTAIRKNEEFVDTRNDRVVTMQIDPISDIYKEDGVYEELDGFLGRQSAVEEHTVDVNGEYGHIEITAAESTDIHRCTRTLVENYRNEANI